MGKSRTKLTNISNRLFGIDDFKKSFNKAMIEKENADKELINEHLKDNGLPEFDILKKLFFEAYPEYKLWHPQKTQFL